MGRIEASDDDESIAAVDVRRHICEQVLEGRERKVVTANTVSIETQIWWSRG
jgi:hypothetical protein